MRTRVIWFFLCLIASPALFASGGGGGGGGGSAMSATPAAPQLTAQQWYSQGYTAAKSGKYAEAITDFKEAVNLQPNYPEALNMEGVQPPQGRKGAAGLRLLREGFVVAARFRRCQGILRGGQPSGGRLEKGRPAIPDPAESPSSAGPGVAGVDRRHGEQQDAARRRPGSGPLACC